MTRSINAPFGIGARRLRGFTLVEVMISITIASLLSLAVVSAYSTQAGIYMNQGRSSQSVEDGREVYRVLSHLLRQAENSSIVITQVPGASTTIDFTVPAGFPIWPNTTAPYSNNAVRISWSATGSYSNQITVATAATIGGLGAAQALALAGSNSGNNTRVIGMTMNAVVPAGYSFTVTTRAGATPPGMTAAGTTFDGLLLPGKCV